MKTFKEFHKQKQAGNAIRVLNTLNKINLQIMHLRTGQKDKNELACKNATDSIQDEVDDLIHLSTLLIEDAGYGIKPNKRGRFLLEEKEGK